MTQKEMKKRYLEMVNRIEEREMYDGRNTMDLYQCPRCYSQMFTTYADKGVTPFCIRCKNCGGTMTHTQTFPFNEALFAKQGGKKFYRPSLKELNKLRAKNEIELVEHVLNGGLILEE